MTYYIAVNNGLSSNEITDKPCELDKVTWVKFSGTPPKFGSKYINGKFIEPFTAFTVHSMDGEKIDFVTNTHFR
jgi:hypothetical protein